MHMEPADEIGDGAEKGDGDDENPFEKWRGVADPAQMRGYIDSHGDDERHRRNIQRGASTAETDPDRDRDRNPSETAGNWPGINETL